MIVQEWPNIKNKKIVLQDQELYLLHKHPTKDKGKEIPYMQDIEPHCIYQAEALYLPTDNRASNIVQFLLMQELVLQMPYQ